MEIGRTLPAYEVNGARIQLGSLDSISYNMNEYSKADFAYMAYARPDLASVSGERGSHLLLTSNRGYVLQRR